MKNNLKIDRRRKLGLEEQFKNSFKNYLSTQKHTQNSLIPSPLLMAELLDVSIDVADKVYLEFINENLIELRNDLYYKVEPFNVIFENETQDLSLTKLAKKIGLKTQFEILSREWVVKFKLLEIDDTYLKGRYLKVKRLNYFNNEKEAFLVAYIHESLLNESNLNEIETNGFSTIMNQLMIEENTRRRVLSIIEADAEVYEILECESDTPITFSHQTVINSKGALLFYLDFYTAHEAFLTLEKVDIPKYL